MTPEDKMLQSIKQLKETCEKAKAEDEKNGRFNPVYTIFAARLDEIIKTYEEETFPEC